MIEEKFGGKFIRISIPAKKAMLNDALADRALDYGLQLIATLLSGEKNVAAGDSSSFELLNLAKRVASTDVTVFVNGPTGTGKEVLAKFVHNHSSRTAAPFVGVNCAAIPENMLEAILFGYEKGAFTGASTSNKGIFRAADSGTLLLDEISEMPLGLQAKLLRVLQEKAVTPIGSQTDIPVDVRVIATTNRDMAHEIRTGGFREDLYYRLNVFPLNTISVADRALDIVPICTFLMRRHCNEISNIPWLTDGAVEKLTSYSWPGNVRELENVLQRALVLAMDNKITAADIVTDDVIHNMNRQPLTSDSLQNVAVG
jgi:two-component system response regulator FlrC